jgi:hypothetical protein
MSIGGEFPLPDRVDLADRESCALFVGGDREPEFHQVDAVADEHLLEPRRLPDELVVLRGRAETHHTFDARPVVPGAIEEHDLSRSRKVRDIALEVPLAALALRRLLQGDRACPSRVQVFHKALDGSALAGGVAALEDHDQATIGCLDPVLQFQQLDLQQALRELVFVPVHALGVGIALSPRVDLRAIARHEHRIVVVIVDHGVPRDVVEFGRQCVMAHELGHRPRR